MLLEGLITVDEDGEVRYAEGLMTPPNRTWSSDLRKLSDEVKLARNATALGVTPEEFQTLDTATRKWLRAAAKKATVYARGFTKVGWKRLSLVEKLKFRQA